MPGIRALLFLVLPLVGAAAEGDIFSRTRSIMEAKREKYGTPGMVATLIIDGRIAGTLAVGYADRENLKPMTAATQVPAASLTKLITAVLVMRQAERGRLNIDAPVNDYLPSAMQMRGPDDQPSQATLAHLLSHHAGLPASWQGIAWEGQPVESLESFLSRPLIAKYPPGEKIVYANDGFSLAGYVAARTDQELFAAHAERVLLAPLKMRDSVFTSPWLLKSEKLARAYGTLFSAGGLAAHNDTTAALPAGGLISTAPDLARFALMLLNGGQLAGEHILSPASTAELFRIRSRAMPGSRMGFGLGFGVQEDAGRKIVWWDGGLAGVANRMILHPASKSGVVLLSNLSNNAASSEAATEIMEAIVPRLPGKAYRPTEEELRRFAGAYRFYDAMDPKRWYFRYALDLKLRAENGTLVYESRGLRRGVLEPVAPGVFRFNESRVAGADMYLDGEHVWFNDLGATRIRWYSTLPAILSYLSILLLLTVFALFMIIRRIFRRLRPR